MSRIALYLAGLIILGVVLAPLLATNDPMDTDPSEQLLPPSRDNLLGTDFLGRDVWSRVLFGGRRTIAITILATMIAVVPGGVIGVIGGMQRGRIGALISTLLNALLAFPGLILALLILTLIGSGFFSLALATGATQIAGYARVTRTAVRISGDQDFVEVAYALGSSSSRALWNHILPNASPTLLAYGAVVLSYNMLTAAALSFLGLGGNLGIPDWGVMLADARLAFRVAPWISVAPGLAITVIVLAANQIADRVARTAKDI